MIDFHKKKTKYDAEGFDADGYNRLGYDRMGYDKDGYDIHGFNKEGISRTGVNKVTGRDPEGFDIHVFDLDGYNREGYNLQGYNREGFNREGFDVLGFDVNGYNAQGYDKDGYDKNGFDETGFNIQGYDIVGYDREGYDQEGYDLNGFNKEGFNREGYDQNGFDKRGYDIDGYDIYGLNSNGYNRDGYDADGYNYEGYDRDGFDKDGFNQEGYDVEGYDKKGFDKNGRTRLGYEQSEFDDDGFHKNTGLDVWGFNRYGYNVNGINRYTGRDRLGFDADGYDEQGFNIWGINPDTEEDRYGNSLSIYEDNENFSEELCEEFQNLYYGYMAGKHELASSVANAYCNGKGTVKDFHRALRVLVDTAYEYEDMDAIRALSDFFYIGEVVQQNVSMSLYLNEIVDSKKTKSINQYRAGQALKFMQPVNITDNIFKEESEHLERLLSSIADKIANKRKQIVKLDNDTSWMDRDQRLDWLEKKERNNQIEADIKGLEQIERKPYYARMDFIKNNVEKKIYIGENYYKDDNPNNNVSSWASEVGNCFRDSRKNTFVVNGEKITVSLRRKFVIEEGKLLDYFDEFDSNSDAGKAEITDPYLLHILEEKRGEKNITNIIRTIQQNQNDIIEENFDANLVVQGCAGSGKTMIMLHRLANLKFKNKDYEWDNVKIITPNRDFTLFIDELSKDLKINEIEKLTLSEYYIELIEQYYDSFLERVEKDGEIQVIHYKGFDLTSEKKKIRKDAEWNRDIVRFIYSNGFKKEISKIVKRIKDNNGNLVSFGSAWREFDTCLHLILDNKFKNVEKRIPNYNCILYAKVLYLYSYLGKLRKNVKMLCIDEGQDISENQYVLLYDVNGRKTCLNVYGDLSQRIKDNISITNWEKLKTIVGAKYYELNENYRNSEEIINFYNKQLKKNNMSFGLVTKPVERFEDKDLDILVKLQLFLKNRVVIITKDKSIVPTSVLSLCVQGEIVEGRVSVMDVAEVKGLEFDTAFVYDEEMDASEKYISYTRALSELYVQTSKGVETIALGIGDESNMACDIDLKSLNKTDDLKTGDYFEKIEVSYPDESVYFDDDVVLLDKEGIYLTMLNSEFILNSDIYPDCLCVRLCLRKEIFGELNLKAKNICINGNLISDECEIFIPDKNEKEQIVTFSIPKNKLSREDIDEISFSVQADITTAKNKYKYLGDAVNCDADGYLIDGEDDIEWVFLSTDDEFESISELESLNNNKCLIVVRNTWNNDFCFVVERYENQYAVGTEYLNGKEYRENRFNKNDKQFKVYQGPSRAKIENHYISRDIKLPF